MPAKNSHTWILLRGLAREKAHWGDFVERFAARVPQDEVLPIDLPGSGEFYRGSAPRSVSEMFNFVRAQAVERARTQGSFKILALSLGGMVAMEWMRQKSDDLHSVVLINSSSRDLSPFHARLRWQVYRHILKLLSIQAAREREHGIIELLMNSDAAQELALPLWTKIALERPISYLNFVNQIYAASRFAGFTTKPAVPTLLLNSLGDKLVDPSCSTRMHERWQWPIVRHPWAGHDLPWDDAAWTIDKIVAWDAAQKT